MPDPAVRPRTSTVSPKLVKTNYMGTCSPKVITGHWVTTVRDGISDFLSAEKNWPIYQLGALDRRPDAEYE